jgi:hypothetical protein
MAARTPKLLELHDDPRSDPMTQKEPYTEMSANRAMPTLIPTELAKMAGPGAETIVQMQKDMFDTLAEMNQRWLGRTTAEAKLASELGAKLVAARSFPESAEACQQWMAQRVKMATEDGQRFATDSQKFMEATARLFSNGWSGERT